jgi:hypothetical protein
MSNWDSCNTCSSSITIPVGEKGDAGKALATVVTVTTATYALPTDVTGTVVYLARSAGSTVTLPDDPATGTTVDFVVSTDSTTGSYIVETSGGGFLMGYANVSKSGSTTIFSPNALGSDTTVTMNGTTTGGLVGTDFSMTYVGSDQWNVRGNFWGSGALATPFS